MRFFVDAALSSIPSRFVSRYRIFPRLLGLMANETFLCKIISTHRMECDGYRSGYRTLPLVRSRPYYNSIILLDPRIIDYRYTQAIFDSARRSETRVPGLLAQRVGRA